MNKDEPLNLYRWRNVGETFSDAFKIMRLNLKPLAQGLVFIAVPIILLIGVAMIFAFPNYFVLTGDIELGPFWDRVMFNEVLIIFSLNMLFFSLAVTPVSIVTILVLHHWATTRQAPGLAELGAALRKHFLPLMAAKLVMFPFIFLPSLLLAVPGLAFYTLFVCVELLILEKDMRVFQAIGKSFEYMGKFFWPALGINILAFLVFIGAGWALELPMLLLGGVENITSLEFTDSGFFKILKSVMEILSLLVSYMFYVLPTLVAGLIYYSVMERIQKTQIKARIAEIGSLEDEEDIYQEDEQY